MATFRLWIFPVLGLAFVAVVDLGLDFAIFLPAVLAVKVKPEAQRSQHRCLRL